MKKDINNELDQFLDDENKSNDEAKITKKIVKDKSITERIEKKILLEDGRQLLSE